jgi:non-specific protein-tyrosine kinase
MKIKKAIEKAKQAREAGITTASLSHDKAAKKAELVSPVYSESRFIEPDRAILAENRCIGMFHDSPYLGPYKVLRTQIHKLTKDTGLNTIMVTSPLPGEGKTLLSINLALTFAKEFDQTVLLMDCDLHRQDVHKYLGIENDKGLVDYLIDEMPLKDLIVWPGIEKMTLISGDRTIHESTEFLSSPRMRALMDEVKHRYADRYVIFDVPPVLSGADAITFASLVDCIIMVVDAGKTSLGDVKKALELIPKEKFLGFVLNRDTSTPKTYYSYY